MNPSRNASLTLLGLMVAALAGWNWTLGQGPFTPTMLMLGLLALASEAAAVALPGLGFFSAAAPAYLALAALPGGAGAAAAFCLLGLALRALKDQATNRLESVLLDATPVLLSLPLVAALKEQSLVFALLAAGLVYLFVHAGLSRHFVAYLGREERLAWNPVYRRLRLTRVATVCAALPLTQTESYSLAMLPLLWATYSTAANIVHRAYIEEVDEVKQELGRSEQQLDQARLQAARSERELALSKEEKVLLEEYPTALGVRPDLDKTLNVTLDVLTRLVRADNICIFLDRGGLRPVAHQGLRKQVVEAARLGGLSEPLAQRALESQQMCLRSGTSEDGLFPKDRQAVAFPLGGDGVLYLGRDSTAEFSDEQLRLLALIASQAALAIASAEHYQAEKRALELHTEANTRLQGWVERLNSLLEWSTSNAETLEEQALLDSLQRSLETIPHQFGALVREGRLVRRWPAEGCRPQAVLALAEAAEQVLSIDDLERSRFEPPFQGCLAVLVAPIRSRSGSLGAVLLGATAGGSFDEVHHRLLQLLASQSGVALSNALHFRALQESQAQLIQSGKMAAVGQLAAGVAHELNSPLGAIQLAVSSAIPQLEKKPDSALRKLEKARGAAERARAIIDKLLVFSRKSEKTETRMSLAAAVSQAVELIGHQLSRDRVQLSIDVPQHLSVVGRSNELQQVVLNLLLNARDAVVARADSQRRVELTAEPEEGGVALRLADDGVGLSQEDAARVFEPFFTTKELGKGTGLGLAVSHQIVSDHGGKISVESNQAGGATFTVWLPSKS